MAVAPGSVKKSLASPTLLFGAVNSVGLLGVFFYNQRLTTEIQKNVDILIKSNADLTARIEALEKAPRGPPSGHVPAVLINALNAIDEQNAAYNEDMDAHLHAIAKAISPEAVQKLDKRFDAKGPRFPSLRNLVLPGFRASHPPTRGGYQQVRFQEDDGQGSEDEQRDERPPRGRGDRRRPEPTRRGRSRGRRSDSEEEERERSPSPPRRPARKSAPPLARGSRPPASQSRNLPRRGADTPLLPDVRDAREAEEEGSADELN